MCIVTRKWGVINETNKHSIRFVPNQKKKKEEVDPEEEEEVFSPPTTSTMFDNNHIHNHNHKYNGGGRRKIRDWQRTQRTMIRQPVTTADFVGNSIFWRRSGRNFREEIDTPFSSSSSSHRREKEYSTVWPDPLLGGSNRYNINTIFVSSSYSSSRVTTILSAAVR